MSNRLTTLDHDRQRAVLEKLGTLPQWIGLIGPRVLSVMADLSVGRQPNLAVALVTDGTLVVSVESPLLHGCADDLGISYRLV